jgi:hypothetical protein
MVTSIANGPDHTIIPPELLYIQPITSYYMFKSFVYIFLFVLEFFSYLMMVKRMTETCSRKYINPLNPELKPICYLLVLLAHHFLHVSRIRVKSLTIRLLMSHIYMERLFLMFLDHTQRRSTVGRTPLDE